MKTKNKLLLMTYTAVFAALICVTTAFVLHIPVGNGYIHVGDGIIYVAASVLPFPFGMIAASLGGGLADFLSGYYIYIIPTVIIKLLNALCFYLAGRSMKLFSFKSIMVSVVSGLVTIVGYFIADFILFGNFGAAFAAVFPGVLQPIGSTLFYCVIAFALDKISFKERISVLNGKNM